MNTSTNLHTPQNVASGKSVGEQIQQVLFPGVTPRVVDPSNFPELLWVMGTLQKFRRRLATLAGDHADDYDVVLAESGIAMIDQDGTIYVGAPFLAAYQKQEELLVGILAHEIGHRPKRWRELHEQNKGPLSREEIDAICRHEETRADLFAGAALAELGMSCEPVCEFLLAHSQGGHPAYFEPDVRAQVIREAHEARDYRAQQRAKLFPNFDKMTSLKGYLGEG